MTSIGDVVWIELPGGAWFAEGPDATELLLKPVGEGRWRWSVSQHTVTAFVLRASGTCADRRAATRAAEEACLNGALR